MKVDAQDPVLWMLFAGLLLGLAGLIWIIGRWRRASGPHAEENFSLPAAGIQDSIAPLPALDKPAESPSPADFPSPFVDAKKPPLGVSPEVPAAPAPGPVPFAVTGTVSGAPPAGVPAGPGVGGTKNVLERLDGMAQRLTEMQSALLRQTDAGPGGSPSGGASFGQGFTPETVEKLLKIIGNVMSQIDVLQKSLGSSSGGGANPPVGSRNPFAGSSKGGGGGSPLGQ